QCAHQGRRVSLPLSRIPRRARPALAGRAVARTLRHPWSKNHLRPVMIRLTDPQHGERMREGRLKFTRGRTMRVSSMLRSVLVALAVAGTLSSAAAEPLAKEAFGSQRLPAATNASVHGSYSKGCFAGGVAIAADGPHWQAM